MSDQKCKVDGCNGAVLYVDYGNAEILQCTKGHRQ